MNFFQKIPVFVFSLLYPIKVYGKENIPQGGAVFSCNHFRAIDCGFIALISSKKTKYLAKKEIFKNKTLSKEDNLLSIIFRRYKRCGSLLNIVCVVC